MNLFKHVSPFGSRRQSRLSSSLTSLAAGALVVLLAGCGDSGSRQVDTAEPTTAAQPRSDDAKPAQETASSPDAAVGYGAAGTRATDATSPQGVPAQPGAVAGAGTVPQQQQVAGEAPAYGRSDATVAGKQAMTGDILDTQGLERGIRESLRTSEDLGLTGEQLQQVKITVANDIVTLTGTVPTREVARNIEQRVKQHPGVDTVQNWLNAQE